MNPSDYRRDFHAYHTTLAHERHRHHAGLSPRLDTEAVEERYADLWTREAIADLRRALEETPAHFETERRGLRALAASAQLKHVESRAAEVTQESGRCAGAARVEWDGQRVAAEGVPELLAAETDAARRHELSRRWLDALRPCDDLRAARLEALGAATHESGFEHRRALYESVTGVELPRLADEAERFLALTERAYMTGLSRWAANAFAPAPPRALSFADEFRFVRAPHLDAHFPAAGFEAAYAETLDGLGLRAASQRNLRIDAAERAGKLPWPECFAVAPPDDVRLVISKPTASAAFLRQAFMEGGRAQMFAWASRETAARHPEFLRPPDAATERGHALLFAGLFRDPAWLGGHRGLRASAAEETARSFALVELHDARRECAALRHALALDASTDVRSEQLAETYAAGHSAASGFRHDAATRLRDAEDLLRSNTETQGPPDFFRAATNLRARLFAVAFGEHLRGRHGRRWFAARAAGDELVDVWNTASRHTVEELARLVWGGEISFELLAETLSAGAEGLHV
jgi:hypothetical protein